MCACLAENTVDLLAELAGELVDLVLIHTPALAVGRLAVEAVLLAALGDAQPQVQEALVLLLGQELSVERNKKKEGRPYKFA